MLYNMVLAFGGTMKLNLKTNLSLYDDTFYYVTVLTNEENAKEFKTNLRESMEMIKMLLNTNIETLSDQELYDFVKRIYYISITDMDILKIISKKNNRNYTKIVSLPTTMTYYDEMDNKDKQVVYIVGVKEGVNLSINKTYLKREIIELILNGSIVILRKEGKALKNNLILKEKKCSVISDLGIDCNNYSFINDNFEIFLSLLRNELTKEKMHHDAKILLQLLEEEINRVFNWIKIDNGCYCKIATLCKKWYDNSLEKKEYNHLTDHK